VRGRGGSQHLCRDGFFSNGVQGGIVPVAAGLAMAQRLAGRDGLAAVFIGDGTLGQGVVYETFNLVSKWSLPLLIVLEDNRIAQSTPRNKRWPAASPPGPGPSISGARGGHVASADADAPGPRGRPARPT